MKKGLLLNAMKDENRHVPWSEDEIKLVIEHNITDAELSSILGRSVSAIQAVRHRYKDIINIQQHLTIKDIN